MDRAELAKRLMATFLDELEEHVRAMSRDLLALEREGAGARRSEIVAGLFRTAHSLKGASRSVGVGLLENVCHRLEELLLAARDGTRTLGAEEFRVFFRAADAIEDAGKRLRTGADLTEGALPAVLVALGNVARGEAKAASAKAEAHARAEAEAGAEAAARAGATAEAVTKARVPRVDPHASDGFVRVRGERLDALLVQSGELVVARNRLERASEGFGALRDWAAQWRADARVLENAPPLPRATAAALARTTENVKRLERDLDRMSQALARDVRFVGQTALTLDEEVRRIRMVPFAEACATLERAVRDLAASSTKEVDLVIEGGSVMLDRYIVQHLKDPLLHLVRNAIDHGIEPPHERSAAGKPPRGRVVVSAAVRGTQVEVRVEDDGRGLDMDAIRARAAQLGESGDDRDLARVVFRAGFSTAPIVTEVSGRGIGLDVVNDAVSTLHGTTDVTWERGRGATFIITLPITLTTLRVLFLGAGGQTFAVAGVHVQRIARMRVADLVTVDGRDMVTFADRPVPVVSLAETLGITEAPRPQETIYVVRIAAGGREVAFVVDALASEEEVVVKGLGARLVRVRNVIGATILATGRVALILHGPDLVRSALRRSPAHRLSAPRADAPAPKRRLLVVDDSVTTRTLEKTILEGAGYDVTVAADGSEAFRLLQERPVDLVVSDVEMPRMDGFALCEAIRASRRLHDLPVVLVTALASENDKLRGLESGASAYLVKSAFDQKSLLETIAQLL